MHYLINAMLEKGGMLPSYAPWCCSLEAYQRGMTVTNYFWSKSKQI